MPKIIVVSFNKEISPLPGESIFTALRRHGVPIASSCGGDGVCAKCVVKITKGASNLTSLTAKEVELVKKHSLGNNERLACRAEALGDVELSTSYW